MHQRTSASLYSGLTSMLPVDNNPATGGHRGSAFESGWYGYVSKDLRAVLGDSVAAPFPQKFCGAGDLAACRQMLLTTLQQAVNTPATTVYPGDGTCAAGDQSCAAEITYSTLGAIALPAGPWVNRPTYQQVVEFADRRSSPSEQHARP